MALVAVVSQATSQGVIAEKPISVSKQATRLVRLLELPSRRLDSARKLLKLGKDAVPALTRAMNDPRLEVVCRVAIFLRMMGDDAKLAIPTLRKVVKGSDPKLAYAAQWALSAFHPIGITMVADYAKHRIIEFDESGKEVLEITKLKGIFGAERLPNGNYLIALAGQSRVQEIDRKGKVIWEYQQKSINPLGATRLPTGHTLIANTSGGVLEVDMKGKVVWQARGQSPWKAQGLQNGNVLIANGSGAVELNRKGEKVRSFSQAKQIHEARRLANGNTLLASYKDKSVVEVTPAGKKLLSIDVGSMADTAIRTPDGATIAGGTGFVSKYDAKGKLLWKRKVGRAGSVRYY